MQYLEHIIQLLQADFNLVNEHIKTFNVQEASAEEMLILLRVTFPVKHSLPDWNNFIERVSEEIIHRGLDKQKLLRGLT
jgi:hypothetical protein